MPMSTKLQVTAFLGQKTARGREDWSIGCGTWQHKCRELAFQVQTPLLKVQSIAWKSGSCIRQPPSSQGQGILTPPPPAAPAEPLYPYTKCWIIHSARWQKSEKSQSVSRRLWERKVGHLDSSSRSTNLLGGEQHRLLGHSWPKCPISLYEEDFSENSDRGVLGICILSNTRGSQAWIPCILGERSVSGSRAQSRVNSTSPVWESHPGNFLVKLANKSYPCFAIVWKIKSTFDLTAA